MNISNTNLNIEQNEEYSSARMHQAINNNNNINTNYIPTNQINTNFNNQVTNLINNNYNYNNSQFNNNQLNNSQNNFNNSINIQSNYEFSFGNIDDMRKLQGQNTDSLNMSQSNDSWANKI